MRTIDKTIQRKKQRSKKIRKGDKVIAITGNNRGQSGTVLAVNGMTAIVQGLNVRKKHVKRSQAQPNGGIVDLEKPIHISNLKVCVRDEQPVKLKVRQTEQGDRELYYREGSDSIRYRSLKKS